MTDSETEARITPIRPADLAGLDRVRLLIAGDTHGTVWWTRKLIDLTVEFDCLALVQLGDFGFWPHTRSGQTFLKRINGQARSAGVPLWWIDGNHENHDALDEQARADDGTVPIADWITYLPRGFRFEAAGQKIGCLGGAFSIDHRFRSLGTDWWIQEVLTDADVLRLQGKGREHMLDVLLTHDAPLAVPLAGMPLSPSDQAAADASRQCIDDVLFSCWPRLLLHGHWHHRYTYELGSPFVNWGSSDLEAAWRCRVEGLASDEEGDGSAWGVLELTRTGDRTFRDGTALAEAR